MREVRAGEGAPDRAEDCVIRLPSRNLKTGPIGPGQFFALSDTFGAILTDSLQQTGHFIVIAESDMRGAAMAAQELLGERSYSGRR